MDKLTVYAVYSNNDYVEVKDYELNSDVIASTGLNTYVVTYKGKIAKFNVYGRTIKSISASCAKSIYAVGNMPVESDITVMMILDNDQKVLVEKGYTVSPNVVSVKGNQEFIVSYRGYTATLTLYGYDYGAVGAIAAVYNGKGVIQGQEIPKNDLEVTAAYENGHEERVSTYTMDHTKFYDTGDQKLTVYFGGKQASVTIPVKAREIVSLAAVYIGKPVMYGKNVLLSDFEVEATYNDDTKEKVTDFVAKGRKIKYIGSNTVRIVYGGMTVHVEVEGTDFEEPDFTYVSTVSVSNGKREASIDTAIPKYLDEDAMIAKSYKKIVFKRAYKKLKCSEDADYIAFLIDFGNPDNEVELPLNIRITIPEKFDIQCTELYYAPNRRTILGRMNKMVLGDRVIQSTLYRVGYYMLVYDPALGEDEFDYEDYEADDLL